ncbi:actin cortical patch SUR7/pH-response regulator pali [Scheffersomyces coipomensis]|uniref:actin cortical patch SUR7/pH-response regulator pali n=1 Tax=Scheffersomyces coipomensis TaxID=1788519 RepID=UPI00315DE4B2
MFKFFRFILIVFSLACTVLSVFALVGSYANKSYLTSTYLLNFHLTQANLSAIITDGLDKRSIGADIASATSEFWSSVQTGTAASDIDSSIQSAISEVTSGFTYAELGLADVYQIGYWGYCKGYVLKEEAYGGTLGSVLKPFDNSHVNYTWCSPPKAGFKFDPLVIFKTEIGNKLNNTIEGASTEVSPILTQAATTALQLLLQNLTWDNLNLPGDLKAQLTLLNGLTVASFGIILAVAVLSFISVILQLFGCCFSPDNCCLSFLNFSFELLIFILSIVGAGLATGAYYFTRSQINDNTTEFGIKAFLSINLYAFLWSSVVAALLVVIFNLLGHCCGLFGTGRRRYRAVAPAAAYEHKEMYDDESD